jgi:hypothetical protein
MICMPLAVSTLSKTLVNLASRSLMRNLTWSARSSRSISRFRACCAVHAPAGLVVTPRTWTRRVSISITKKTYRRLRNTVSTCRKSQASRPDAWEVRNCRQVGEARRVPGQALPQPGSGGPSLRRCGARGRRAHLGCADGPSGVLPCQPDGQVTDLTGDRRAPGPGRAGTVSCDQLAVPGQQRAGRGDPVAAQPGRQDTRQSGQDHSISPVRLRLGNLAA